MEINNNDNDEVLTKLSLKYTRLLSSEDTEYIDINDSELCVGTKSINHKRKRENPDLNVSSNIQLTGTIAQYLLSRVPLPTTRSDIQRKFLKHETSKKIDLDSILMDINDRFKSTLGLGIFGLNKKSNKITNHKYYVVQLCRSSIYLESIYQFGYIDYKSIGELSIIEDKKQLISPQICNYFLSFISFLFGFFAAASTNQKLIEDNDESSQIVQINDKIEIPIKYLLELITEFTGVTLNNEKIINDLNALLNLRSKICASSDENDTIGHEFSKISILIYILFRSGYIDPVFLTKNNVNQVSGISNGEVLKWDSSYIDRIINSNKS